MIYDTEPYKFVLNIVTGIMLKNPKVNSKVSEDSLERK
jgi:hypothetical protein